MDSIPKHKVSQPMMEMEDKAALKKFFSTYPTVRFKKGDTIIRDLDPFTNVYFIKHGHVRLYTVSDCGKEVSLFIYKAGWHFPTLIGFSNTESRYNFEAMSAVEAYCAPFGEFVSFLRQSPDLLFDLVVTSGKMMDSYFKRIELLMTESTKKSLAFMLLQFSEAFQGNEDKSVSVGWVVPLSHQQIATWINTSRETVSRYLEEFKKEGSIDIANKKICIRNKGALLSIVESSA